MLVKWLTASLFLGDCMLSANYLFTSNILCICLQIKKKKPHPCFKRYFRTSTTEQDRVIRTKFTLYLEIIKTWTKIYVMMECKIMDIRQGRIVTLERCKTYEVSPTIVLVTTCTEFPVHSTGKKSPGGAWQTPWVEEMELKVWEG